MANKVLSSGALPAEWVSIAPRLSHSSCRSHPSCRRAALTLCAGAGIPPKFQSSSSPEAPIHSNPSTIPPQTHFFTSTSPEPLHPSSFIKQWSLLDQHLFLFTTCVCVTGGAVTALFLTAIPTLLAFKRAAESLEKLLEVTREELPGTMAAVRLSGMEISDLTMELSELGQEISSGVKSSARAVRAAQDGLRRVSNIASMAFLQEPRGLPQPGSTKPAVAVAARVLHDKVTEMRMILRSFSSLRYVLGWLGKLWRTRRRQLPSTSVYLS